MTYRGRVPGFGDSTPSHVSEHLPFLRFSGPKCRCWTDSITDREVSGRPWSERRLLMAMAPLAVRQHFAACHIQGCEQRRRAVPHVIVGIPFNV